MPFDVNQPSYESFRGILTERTSTVIAWTGSGLSVQAGLPTWCQLREQLCEALLAKMQTIERQDRYSAMAKYQLASREENLWIAFEILEEALGNTTYRTVITNSLAKADTANIPRALRDLFELGISGLLTLNLDRLASRAFSEERPGVAITQFNGRNAATYAHVLQGRNPFIANLHGTAGDRSSWVFTKRDLKSLSESAGYREFINTCLLSRTILFVGISADDVAAGGYLSNLTNRGLSIGDHFWLTSRTDSATDRWAEEAGIQVIRYNNQGGSHADLEECFNNLKKHVPKDERPNPVVAQGSGDACSSLAVLPDPKELAREDAEPIRQALNMHAADILNGDAPGRYKEYEEFVRKYNTPIYRAWEVTTVEPDNKLLGYSLHEIVAEGAFGSVYRAADLKGNAVAVKVLHEGVRRNSEMLQGFRRGVQSMKILSDQRVEGVVTCHDAAEIPAFVVMDLIDGPNLQEPVEKRLLDQWDKLLEVGVNLAQIIRSSHALPQRVLHRDVRPANVMLRNGWSLDEEWNVVVLDFDLSWHRDATEVSITKPGTLNGYLAPEQVVRSRDQSTRSAMVDSFGLGMTLFFMRTQKHPEVMQHKHQDWMQTLLNEKARYKCAEWKSVPMRYFRLIFDSTKHRQSERLDVGQIAGELERLLFAVRNPTRVTSAELLADEMMCRATDQPYHWDRDQLCATIEFGNGVQLKVRADETEREIRCEIEWKETGAGTYSKITKWLPKAYSEVEAIFKRAGWEVDGGTAENYQLAVSTRIKANALRHRLSDATDALVKALDVMPFH